MQVDFFDVIEIHNILVIFMKMKILVCLLGLFGFSTVMACSQLPAEHGLLQENDGDGDGVLSLMEWKKAGIGNYFVAFRLGDELAFEQLDRNHDNYLNANELEDTVRYRRSPCADWEEQMMQMRGE